MYSPKIKEEFIPMLYRLKLKEKRPMTMLVNEAVEIYLKNKQADERLSALIINPIDIGERA